MVMLERYRKQLIIAALIIVVFLAGFAGAVIGANYPSWANNLSFLPTFLKPKTSALQEVTVNNQKVIRTVEDSAVIDAVSKASPAVVSVVAKVTQFSPGQGVVQSEQGIGTGFIVRSDGVILTNNHVVSDRSIAYTVVTKDQKTYPVKKIDYDPAIDFAILKVDAKGLATVQLGDSDSLKAGQTVVAIGNALGMFDNTVTVGVVSGIGRVVTASSSLGVSQETLANVIQTDAALNPGNSGGPLLDLSGNVVGINFATTTSAQNIGFVIPINRVKGVLDQYLATGKIVRPFLGIGYLTVDEATALIQSLPQGAYIRQVVSGSPAEKAGLEVGDVVTKFGDVALKDGSTLASGISKYKVGQTVEMEVWRDGKTLKLKATLTEAPQ